MRAVLVGLASLNTNVCGRKYEGSTGEAAWGEKRPQKAEFRGALAEGNSQV